MHFGFIGAGKVGFSMGKYLTERGMQVTGYFSRSPQSSLEAANFTDTRRYLDMRSLAEDSDAIFLTVPDGVIAAVWEELRMLPIQGKIIIHCSGMLSSAVFSEIGHSRAYGYSIHPLLAVSDKYTSWEKLAGAFFAMEGHEKYLSELKQLFEGFGNSVGILTAEGKVRYHAAAAMASNLYVGLCSLSESLLCDCGFSREAAHEALAPLIVGNAVSIGRVGCASALTGPIERNDVGTVAVHLADLSGETREIYRLLSKQVVRVAKEKHPDWDYTELKGALEQ